MENASKNEEITSKKVEEKNNKEKELSEINNNEIKKGTEEKITQKERKTEPKKVERKKLIRKPNNTAKKETTETKKDIVPNKKAVNNKTQKKSKKEIIQEPKEKVETKKKDKKISFSPKFLWWIGSLVLIIILFLLIFKQPATDETTGSAILELENDKVQVDMYVMSRCVYGVLAEQAFEPAMKEMGDVINLNINYIASEVLPGEFRSLQGEPEIKGNIAQLCVIKYEDNWFDFIACQNKNPAEIPNNWESCAKSLGMNIKKIESCYEGKEGKELLSESLKKAEEVNAMGSPTIYINNVLYQGAREEFAFMRAICEHVEHAHCEEIPMCSKDFDCQPSEGKIAICENPGTKEAMCIEKDPIFFGLTILNDEKCQECDTMELEIALKNLFIGAQIEKIDISSELGTKLVKDLEITVVPALVFEKKVMETQIWNQIPEIREIFQEKGDYLQMVNEAIGASHPVTLE